MKNELKPDTWIWVVVQNPGANEEFLGQAYEDQHESFIPAFFEKRLSAAIPHFIIRNFLFDILRFAVPTM